MTVGLLSRRASLGLILSTAALAACGKGGGAGGGEVLRVGSQRGGTKTIMLASKMLEGVPYRIEWSEFPAAQHLLEALGAGAVDVGGVGDAPFLFAYQAGSPIKAVQSTRYNPRNIANAVLVPKGSPAKSFADLRGRKIATGRGSVGHFLLLRALEKYAMKPADVQIIFLPPGDAKAAFASGSIDAWVVWNPYAGAALLHDGARAIVDARGVTTGYGYMVAGDAAIAARRPLIADFLARYARGQQWAAAHLDDYAGALARETGLPLADARYFADNELRAVPSDAHVLAELNSVQETFRAAGAIQGTRPLEAAFDRGFGVKAT